MLRMDPSISILIRRSSVRGMKNVMREQRWFASFGVLFGVLLMMQILLFSLIGAQTMKHMLQSRTALSIEIRSETGEQQRHEFFAGIQQLPFVENAVYITKEQTFEDARSTDPDLIAFLEKYELTNPFLDTIGITLGSLDNFSALKIFLNDEKWRHTVNPAHISKINDQEAQLNELLSIISTGRSISIIIIFISIAVLILIITELVRRRASDRSEEIFVEQMAGANPYAIILPFASEATFLLWAAIVVSTVIIILCMFLAPFVYPAFRGQLANAMGNEFSISARGMFPMLFVAEILLAPVVSFVGAWLGVAPRLKNTGQVA
ncbi:permease-like cell division protein FtsX [Patescibacteria group bacterium]|nr:permease-like cell division protein FtsX [Patescibacteria group bacterium]